MTSASHGKGVAITTGFKSVSDYSYKTTVLDNLNATKSILTAGAQGGFDKSYCCAIYLATSSYVNMILPFVSQNDYIGDFVIQNKDKIEKLLTELRIEYTEIYSYSIQERSEFVLKCEEVISLSIPL